MKLWLLWGIKCEIPGMQQVIRKHIKLRLLFLKWYKKDKK